MESTNPKNFYNAVMPKKFGGDYEQTRWFATPIARAQYDATYAAVTRYALPHITDARSVLELGPGAGTWTKLLLTRNPRARYTLVDISAEMLARARAALAAMRADVTYVESDFLQLAETGQHDFFFSSRAIEYIPDKEAAISTIAALLAPEGIGFLITKTPKYGLAKLRGRIFSDFHKGQIAPRALRSLLEAQDLCVLGTYPAAMTFPLLHSAVLNRILYAIFGRLPLNPLSQLLSESYCVTFQKP